MICIYTRPQEDEAAAGNVHGAAAGNVKTCRIAGRRECVYWRGSAVAYTCTDALHAAGGAGASIPAGRPEGGGVLGLSAAEADAVIHGMRAWDSGMCAE